DRNAAGHGLDQDGAELLLPARRRPRGERKTVEGAVERPDVGVLQDSEELQPAVEAELAGELLQPPALRAVAGDGERRARQRGERADEHVDALLGLEPAGEADPEAGP